MGIKRRLQDRVAAIFELPGDVMGDMARISLVGDTELLVENHRGLSEYRVDQIVLRTPQADLCIRGEQLLIDSISPEQIVIQGRIQSLAYFD